MNKMDLVLSGWSWYLLAWIVANEDLFRQELISDELFEVQISR